MFPKDNDPEIAMSEYGYSRMEQFYILVLMQEITWIKFYPIAGSEV